jgi:hypothetical protein
MRGTVRKDLRNNSAESAEKIRAAKEWPPLAVRQAHPSVLLARQWKQPWRDVLRFDTGLAPHGRSLFLGNRLKLAMVLLKIAEVKLALSCEPASQ